jgi:hypothetical protein
MDRHQLDNLLLTSNERSLEASPEHINNVVSCLSMVKHEADPIDVPMAIQKDTPTEVFHSGPIRTIRTATGRNWLSRDHFALKFERITLNHFARPGQVH